MSRFRNRPERIVAQKPIITFWESTITSRELSITFWEPIITSRKLCITS